MPYTEANSGVNITKAKIVTMISETWCMFPQLFFCGKQSMAIPLTDFSPVAFPCLKANGKFSSSELLLSSRIWTLQVFLMLTTTLLQAPISPSDWKSYKHAAPVPEKIIPLNCQLNLLFPCSHVLSSSVEHSSPFHPTSSKAITVLGTLDFTSTHESICTVYLGRRKLPSTF